MTCRCAFCAADDGRPTVRSRLNPSIAVCESCARATLRQFGDFVQAPGSVVELASRRPVAHVENAD